ncbi:hypothetical protein D3C79_998030 [compost metagenome]
MLVRPDFALTIPSTPVLVMVRSPHLSVAMLEPALRTAVSRKVWSVRAGVML